MESLAPVFAPFEPPIQKKFIRDCVATDRSLKDSDAIEAFDSYLCHANITDQAELSMGFFKEMAGLEAGEKTLQD